MAYKKKEKRKKTDKIVKFKIDFFEKEEKEKEEEKEEEDLVSLEELDIKTYSKKSAIEDILFKLPSVQIQL